jgi:hypothetical protein
VSTALLYKFVVRNAADTADDLVITSDPSSDYPYIAKPPAGEGMTLDPLTGSVTIGAYTVEVIDAIATVPAIDTSTELTDALDYANEAAANLADFTATGDVAFNTGQDLGPYTTSISLTGVSSLAKDFALSPGGVYRFKLWLGSAGTFVWIPAAMTLTSGVNTVGSGRNGDTPDVELSAVILADGTGVVHFNAHTGVILSFTNTYYIAGLTIETLAPGAPTTGRVVTSRLTDSEGRQHLLSRKAYVMESVDGGSTWPVLLAGYVAADALRRERPA